MQSEFLSPVDYRRRIPAKDENNIWYFDRDSESIMVFVHGVNSDSRQCWLAMKDSSGEHARYWPELVARDTRFRDFSIFLAGFAAKLSANRSGFQEAADDIVGALGRRLSPNTRSALDRKAIVFVCHSTGGIVVRYILDRYQKKFQDKTVGLVLIASPSYGSRIASNIVAKGLAWWFNHKIARNLRWGNDLLDDLDGRFRDLVVNRDIPGLVGVEAYENLPPGLLRYIPVFNKMLLVTKESAGRYFGNAKLLVGTDHVSSVKPKGVNHPAHLLLVDFCSKLSLGVQTESQDSSYTPAEQPIRLKSGNPRTGGQDDLSRHPSRNTLQDAAPTDQERPRAEVWVEKRLTKREKKALVDRALQEIAEQNPQPSETGEWLSLSQASALAKARPDELLRWEEAGWLPRMKPEEAPPGSLDRWYCTYHVRLVASVRTYLGQAKLFTYPQIAEIIGVEHEEVLGWIHQGLLRPPNGIALNAIILYRQAVFRPEDALAVAIRELLDCPEPLEFELPAKVWLSHGSDTASHAVRLARELRTLGITVWRIERDTSLEGRAVKGLYYEEEDNVFDVSIGVLSEADARDRGLRRALEVAPTVRPFIPIIIGAEENPILSRAMDPMLPRNSDDFGYLSRLVEVLARYRSSPKSRFE